MSLIRRWRAATAAVVATSVVIVAGAAAVGAKPNPGGGKSTSGTVYIASTPRPSSLVYAAGNVVDKVLGEDAITFTIKPIGNAAGTITAKAQKVTLWTRKGSISGTGSALLTITNHPKVGDVTVSKGTASLTNGTGGETGHSFKITFTGTGSLTTGSYTFHYKGKYK
jgi:hypothetical protein